MGRCEQQQCVPSFAMLTDELGACMSQLQAEAAYQRAAALDATSMLAWQGLAELHTTTGKFSDHFASVSVFDISLICGMKINYAQRTGSWQISSWQGTGWNQSTGNGGKTLCPNPQGPPRSS